MTPAAGGGVVAEGLARAKAKAEGKAGQGKGGNPTVTPF
jgi:hypothetical protein